MTNVKDGVEFLTNKNYKTNWFKNLDKYVLEKSIGWKVRLLKK